MNPYPRITHFPLLTLLLASAALLAHALPGATDVLQYDRGAIVYGEWWRWFTGHLAHFGANHVAWDVGVLIVLGWFCERESRVRMLAALALAALAIPAALWQWQPEFTVYRGLSGLDCALFGLVAGSLIHHTSRIACVVGALALAGFLAKCGFEIVTASTLFAAGDGYAPVPLAHAVGLLAGLGCAARRWRPLMQRPATSPRPQTPC